MRKVLCDTEISLVGALTTCSGVWGALHLKTGGSLSGGMHKALGIFFKKIFACLNEDIICIFWRTGDMERESMMLTRFSKSL